MWNTNFVPNLVSFLGLAVFEKMKQEPSRSAYISKIVYWKMNYYLWNTREIRPTWVKQSFGPPEFIGLHAHNQILIKIKIFQEIYDLF